LARFPPELGVSAQFDDQVVALRIPRIRIAWVMVAIAIAAVGLTVIRALNDYRTPIGELLILGAVPMANVLAVGLLIGQQRPGRRAFLLGFETFGAMALALYVVLTVFFGDPSGALTFFGDLMTSYVDLVIDPINEFIGRDQPLVYIPIACAVCVIMLGWPQVAIAFLGGFLFRRYKVTITRR
jgi:hypothetical protein